MKIIKNQEGKKFCEFAREIKIPENVEILFHVSFFFFFFLLREEELKS